MDNQEKKIGESLLNAYKALPDAKREYLIGFAEGVAAAAKGEPQDTEQTGK